MKTSKKKAGQPLRVGMVGCGKISDAYFRGLQPYARLVEIVACADLDLSRARAKADEHGVSTACSVSDLFDLPDVDAVLNLTVPQAHAALNLAALRAGKHVYCEKPFSLHTAEGVRVLREAKKRDLKIGCAPDTVLGGGIQTCRQLIDEGAIGRPIAATANMLSHGPESWHPSPEFYYQPGAGPLFDMGPYYLTSLITLIGPVKNVSAQAATSFAERIIASQPLSGTKIKVNTPTHLTGSVEFASGAQAVVTMSFDVWAHHLPRIEIYGTEGSLSCPDPNRFDGEVQLWNRKTSGWKPVPLTHTDRFGRGVGLAEMARAIQRGDNPRADGGLALHVVEVMEAFHASATSGRRIAMKTSCERPKALARNYGTFERGGFGF